MLTEYIAFSGIVTAFLCVLLLMAKKYKSSSDNLLILWMIISAANLAYYLFDTPAELDFPGFTLPVLSTPFLYLYVRTLTFQEDISPVRIVKHAWFYIVYTLSFVLTSEIYGPIGFRHKIPYFTGSNYSHLLNLLTLPIAIVPVVYVIVCFRTLKQYQRQIPEVYSNLEKANLNWLKYIFISLLSLFLILVSVISFFSQWHIIPLSSVFKIVACIQSVYLLSIVFFSLRQSIVFNHVALPYKELTIKNTVTDEKSKQVADQLLEYMASKKPYLREELSLSELATLSGLSTHQLSQLINQTLNSSFYKFVNGYRINEVTRKLKDPAFDHYSILGIAFDSGFNSKSTFNKIFKEETGLTPSQYKRSL